MKECRNGYDLAASLPQRVEIECFDKSLGELDDGLMASADDLARDIDKLSSYCSRITGHRDHVAEDVFFERLEQEE